MAIYIIVDKDKDPLDPGEVNAGTTIQVSDGDVFIVDATANDDITFESDSGSHTNFDVQINDTNTNSIDLNFESDLTPTVRVADDVDASDFKIDAASTDAINFTAGDNVSFGEYNGSDNGTDTINIGDGFSTSEDWDTSDGDNDITIGNNATFASIDTGTGEDTLTFGDGATIDEVNTGDGNDTVSFGDDLNANEIKTESGDDDVTIGANATVDELDGGNGTDTLTTQTPGLGGENFETENTVCYAHGTLIYTPDGQRAVETLRSGDMVVTLDNGPQKILWVHVDEQPLEEVGRDSKPVLITAGALGSGLPERDLIVSPQHRILVGGNGQLQDRFPTEVFTPAKSLTSVRGIRAMMGKRKVMWVHFACAKHEVVFANGCLSESLLLGPVVVQSMTDAERKVLADIFGRVRAPGTALNGAPARQCLSVGAARRLLKKSDNEKSHCITREIKKWDFDLAMEHYEAALLHEARPIKQNYAGEA